MNFKWFFLLLLTLTAQAETRQSQITLGGNSGPEEFQSKFADLAVGVSEKWQLTGSFYRSESGEGRLTGEPLDSTELRAGVDWEFHPSASAYIEFIRRQDPYELYGRGGNLGGRYRISDLWKGERKTSLSLGVETLNFEQDVTFTGPRASLNIERDTSQRKGSISLSQELVDWMELVLSFSRYNYSGEPDKLNFVTSRRRTSFSGNGPTYGQTDRSSSITVLLFPVEWSETSLSGSRTRLLGDEGAESRSFTVGQTFFWKGFSLGLEYTVTTFTEDSSGDDDSTQEFLGASVGYEW